MGDVSKHFNRREFECKCGCGFATVDVELLEVLETLRDTYQTPVKINSGCRCPKHNEAVGGEKDSKHMQGIAADIVVTGVPPAKIYQYLDQQYNGKYGIGEYPTQGFVHIDVRQEQARWRIV
jgi:uncharacterized protein YcbK (DUF882 family)